MNGYKFTPVCQTLVEMAEVLVDAANPMLTAERFLVTLLNESAAANPRLSGEEWDKLQAWVKESFIDLAQAKAALENAVTNPVGEAFLRNLYICKRLEDAKRFMGSDVISAPNLCVAIAKAPNAVIKPLLTPVAAEEKWQDRSAAAPDVVSGGELDSLLGLLEDQNAGKSENTPAKPKSADDVRKTFGGGASKPEQTPAQSEQAAATPVDNKTQMAELVARTKRMRDTLKEKIFGQDNAINVLVTGYYQACVRAMTEKKRNRVLASFLFAGPPGVGKTYLAESAAAEMGLPFMRLDMSEFSSDEDSVTEFCGMDEGYRGAHPGVVTSFVKNNPRCVLLFDEVEKAHLAVIHLFLQMLDAGRVRDRHWKEEISFRDVIAIFTTNAGRPLYEDTDILDFSSQSQKVIMKALREDKDPKTQTSFFPAALCSRFASGNVVMFNHMQAHHLRNIAKKEITRLAKSMEESAGFTFDIDESVYTSLLLAEGAAADARTIRGRSETFFNNEIYELFRLIDTQCAKGSLANVNTIKMRVNLDNAPEDVSALFVSGMQPRVLVVADAARVAQLQEHVVSCTLRGAQTVEEAVEIIKNEAVDFALLDFTFGAQRGDNLNIEDVDTPARSFFRFAHEYKQSLPVYLLEQTETAMSDEERISFLRQGARGVVLADNGAQFAEECTQIATVLRQQDSMNRLAKQNKVVAFETAQSVSEDGTCAEISLFDLKLVVAVDADDAKHLLASSEVPNIHFDDIIGAEDAKAELKYFVDFMRNPNRYLGSGVKTPRGLLLYGPPGTGKTMLAKAMACEAGCAYIAAQGNQFRQSYIGHGADLVHRLFRTARKYAPAILFIDEIDAIAKQRTGQGGAGNDEIEATLTAFLAEMDGFNTDPSKPVFVLAATNFSVEPGNEKSLDSALLRRFDNRIYVDLPNKEERARFMKMKTSRNKAFQVSDEQIDSLALRSAGMSLALLDSVLELALRSAIRQSSTVVTDAILENAFENFNHGEEKKWDPATLERVARHEAGHALMSWLGGNKPSYLTVVARGGHGGYMLSSSEDKQIYSRDDLLARIRTSLGGRGAEIVYYGDVDGITSGASGDLEHATSMAQMMVCSLGMDEQFGLAVVDARAAVGELAAEIREAVNRILNQQMAETLRLIRENKSVIDALVSELMYKNHLNEQEIANVLSASGDSNFKD